MPSMPILKATTGVYTSVGLINAILNDPNNTALAGLPRVNATTESIRAVGEEITSFAPRRNQFVNSLINRIAITRIQSLMFDNPWSWAKQGKLELGETVEQIWLDLAKAYVYNADKSEAHFVKQEKPNAVTAFHSVNYQVFYKITVNQAELQKAFLSLDGLTSFIDRIIGQLVRSASYDEFLMMKYTIATLLLAGKMKVVEVPTISADSANEVITDVTETTNLFQFPSTNFTLAGNLNSTKVDDIMVLESATANAYIKVNALASAFNIDYVKFNGNVVMFDNLGSSLDWNRLHDLMHDDHSFREFTDDEIEMLDNIQLICMDRQFMQIYDRMQEMGEPFINGEGLYTNYFYHVWQIFSASPFHNCVAFSTVKSVYSGVTLVPSTSSVTVGQSIQLVATVSGDGFYRSDLVWSISGNNSCKTWIEQNGLLHIGCDEDASYITVYATTKYKDDAGQTVYGTATVAVAEVEKEFKEFITSPTSLTVTAGSTTTITVFALYTDNSTEEVTAVAQGGNDVIDSVTIDGYDCTVVTNDTVGTGYILFTTLDGEHVSDAYSVTTVSADDTTDTDTETASVNDTEDVTEDDTTEDDAAIATTSVSASDTATATKKGRKKKSE